MSDPSEIRLLYVTAPDVQTAKMLAGALVEARLAACVNVFRGGISVYRWHDAVMMEPEAAMIVKTTMEKAAEACALIAEKHPYDCPAIVGFDADAAASSAPFLDWIRAETTG